jgi:NAD(P)-dependent dehydrogenase (short-subunit alcohol dehydrogenase family)
MKIIIIGGTGTIGKAVVSELKQRHTVVIAGHQQGDIQLDIKDLQSIQNMYQKAGEFDAVVSTVGRVHFGTFTEMTTEQFYIGLNDKLMGQVNLVLQGMKYINAGGSFTLTSGILSDDPIRYGSSAAMVNGAINSFVRSAAIEMPKNIRINAISPTVISESMSKYADYFRGFEPVPAARAALAYSKSVEGVQTGQVYRVGW